MALIAGKCPSDDDSSGRDPRKGVKYLVDTTPHTRVLPEGYVLPLQPEINRMSAGSAAIPVIDLSGLDGPVERQMMTAEAIASACAEWGFFRVINHGINASIMEEMLKVVDGFFNLTLEEKMKYASEDVMNPILSNGKYKSVEHRAVVNATRTRISVAVGHGPEMTATVAPASPLVDEKSRIKYRPITYKEHMRAQQSSATSGKSPLQAIMTNDTTQKSSSIDSISVS